jgi:hypothetical protein
VVVLPPDVQVLDLTRGPMGGGGDWAIGRYDEVRGDVYSQPLFAGGRCVHMGIDLGAPAGVAVHAFDAGRVVEAGINPADGDYGPTLVCEHVLDGRPLWVLLGHLATRSLASSPVGRSFGRGAVLGWIGERHENGGWKPHVHVQLCWERPTTHDMPGAVTVADREAARRRYPDPRVVLGPVYVDG